MDKILIWCRFQHRIQLVYFNWYHVTLFILKYQVNRNSTEKKTFLEFSVTLQYFWTKDELCYWCLIYQCRSTNTINDWLNITESNLSRLACPSLFGTLSKDLLHECKTNRDNFLRKRHELSLLSRRHTDLHIEPRFNWNSISIHPSNCMSQW